MEVLPCYFYPLFTRLISYGQKSYHSPSGYYDYECELTNHHNTVYNSFCARPRLFAGGRILHFCIYRCRSPPAARSVTAFQRSDRRCDAWIARKNFFKNHLPLLEVQPPLTVVVAKGEEKYHPPLRTRREVNT